MDKSLLGCVPRGWVIMYNPVNYRKSMRVAMWWNVLPEMTKIAKNGLKRILFKTIEDEDDIYLLGRSIERKKIQIHKRGREFWRKQINIFINRWI